MSECCECVKARKRVFFNQDVQQHAENMLSPHSVQTLCLSCINKFTFSYFLLLSLPFIFIFTLFCIEILSYLLLRRCSWWWWWWQHWIRYEELLCRSASINVWGVSSWAHSSSSNDIFTFLMKWIDFFCC